MCEYLQWNIRGIKCQNRRSNKVNKVKYELQNVQKLKLFSIQETHLRDKSEIPDEWNNFKHLYHILFSGAKNDDSWAGIVLFINKTDDLIESEELHSGRVLYAKIQNKVTHEVKNIFSFYGKTNGSKEEKENLVNLIKNKVVHSSLENVYILGDFNFVSSTLDRSSNSYSNTDKQYKSVWSSLETTSNITDSFRVTNKLRRLYTWSDPSHKNKSRIDRIYIPADKIGRVEATNFESSKFSDHKLIRLRFSSEVKTGPGQWIFNNSLLKNEEFVAEMRRAIHDYCISAANIQNKKVFWDFLKMNMASVARNFSISNTRKEKEKLQDIRNKLESLEAIPPNEINYTVKRKIDELKEEENDIMIKKIKGQLLRAKVPHMEENEISISELVRLEKKNGDSNLIHSLEDKNGNIQEGTENVKNIVYDYYKNLYSKEPENEYEQEQLLSKINKTISIEQKVKLEQPFEKAEIFTSLTELQNDKTPGEDGLTKEFFVFFWTELEEHFMTCINEIKVSDELTSLQKRGLIKIVYKKNGRAKIKNYRPISLLNVDLKIITRLLAKRLISVLDGIIHKNQTCVPGRNITTNIHILQDLIDAINNDNDSAAIIFLDQEKAFDRMSHKFIFKTLEHFGIGEEFIKWVKIIYNDISSSAKVNGHLTSFFKIERGVRQGCPLSALLYVLCAEVLGIEIRRNKSVLGYKVGSKEHKQGQYADDTYVVIKEIKSLNALFEILKKYEMATNAKINADKTEALWIGRWKGRKDRPMNLKWTDGMVKSLGVYVGNDRLEASRYNFEEIKEKIKNKIIFWKGKRLSLKARIKIVNIFILSKVWYVCECCDIPNDILKEINNIILDFVWLDIHQRSINVLQDKYESGGLQLQDIMLKSKAFRFKWVSTLLQASESDFELILANKLIGKHSGTLGINLLRGRSDRFDKNIKNKFYRNCLQVWRELKFEFVPGCLQSISNDWVYENILIQDDDGRVFKPPYNYKNPDKFPYYVPKLFSDLPKTTALWVMLPCFRIYIPKMNDAFSKIKYDDSGKDSFYILFKEEKKKSTDLSFKDVYWLFSDLKVVSRPWILKWGLEFEIADFYWKEIWRNVHDIIHTYEVQSSIWEMMHRNFVCGYFIFQNLNADGMQSNKCKLCHEVEEKRTHVFTTCKVILEIYIYFDNLLNSIFGKFLDEEEKVFGITGIFEDLRSCKLQRLRNYITFSIRHIVFRSRNKDFGGNWEAAMILIKKIEKFIAYDLAQKFMTAIAKNKIDKFVNMYCIDGILAEVDNNMVHVFL